jgi:hypothetical protein
MSTSSSLIKTILHKSLAEGVYRDIVTKNSSYYYILGKTLTWNVDDEPPYPIDSYAYERNTRSEIITMKQIKTTDVSFVIPRVNWEYNHTYDMYDDSYSTEVIGLNILDGGAGYTALPTITVTGGGGTGALFTAIVDIEAGKIIGTETVSKGIGYTSQPTVNITGGGGTGAVIQAVVNIAPSGTQKLEECVFYVMTDEYNVYKCLDNNNNSPSTEKPVGTQLEPIKTPDGYVWKFMYNVPISLRNKFLTNTHIPVVSALTNQFYSNGRLDTIIINNRGSNYTTANIIVQGDGYQENDPIFINGVVVFEGGSSYTTPTVTISPPFSSASPFLSAGAVVLGQKIYNTNKDYYEVIRAGNMGLTEPTHRFGSVTSGTSVLKYIGSTAKGTASVSSGVITGINLIGGIKQVNTVSGGSGYTSSPPVTIVNAVGDTTGEGATAVAVMNNDSILYIKVIDKGANYTIDPDVVIGNEWTASTVVSIGEQYFYSNRLYTVTAAGTTGVSAPTHTISTINAGSFVIGTQYTIATLGTTDYTLIGATINEVGTVFVATGVGSGTGTATKKDSATNGTATLAYAGSAGGAETERQFGAGYSSVPTITLSGAGSGAELAFQTVKSAARLIPIIENEQITGIVVDNPGIGYTVATIDVVGNVGSADAELIPSLNIGNIESLQANNELLTVAGTIDAVKVISGGYNYGVAYVSIVGDGTGATATATIDPNTGEVSKINITNRGQNYTFANVVIFGNGNGASARAILSPQGGHGKNSPDELFARTLMFYGNISGDLNQGLSVDNDYRQIGIIKNPRAYDSSNIFNEVLGSGCWMAEADVDLVNIKADQTLTINRGTEWATAIPVILNEQIYYEDNLYVVSQAGITGATVPVHTSGNEANGTAILQYVGSPKRRYRIVSLTASSVLMQSLDNDTPFINDLLLNEDNYSIILKSVTAPTVDKYSGQLMFIDNKQGFTPTEDETVILRTVIKF